MFNVKCGSDTRLTVVKYASDHQIRVKFSFMLNLDPNFNRKLPVAGRSIRLYDWAKSWIQIYIIAGYGETGKSNKNSVEVYSVKTNTFSIDALT